ncbi:hypothetical protein BC629DRAFT_1440412 [Irpex lacteus]|nr:hypothetical protein BC629DRAFT_1440412 [Irpex lacteus]
MTRIVRILEKPPPMVFTMRHGYDYMQHLRPVGMQEDGVDSVLIEAPSRRRSRAKAGQGPIELIDIPAEALPSTSEIPRNFESQQAIPASISGFQPDMDPHLRLEDADGLLKRIGLRTKVGGRRVGSQVREVKREQKGAEQLIPTWTNTQTEGTPSEHYPILCDWCMSSSSMFRNEGLTTLDERFDQADHALQLQKEYDSDEEGEHDDDSDTDSAPELITSREDFDAMMNEFLDNYEIVGGKMKSVLAGDTAIDKLDTVRKALESKIRDHGDDSDDEGDILMPVTLTRRRTDGIARLSSQHIATWRITRVLSVHGNQGNSEDLLDPKTGLPIVTERRPRRSLEETRRADQRGRRGRSTFAAIRVTVARPKDETKEDKKARKQAVKAERQARRADKKATKEQFSSEIKQQAKRLSDKEKTKLKKL